MTSTRPCSQHGVGILLKQLQHSLTRALSAMHPCILAPPSHLESTPKGVKENRTLSKQEEGATVVGSE